MRPLDIRKYKTELRQRYKQNRQLLPPGQKADWDSRIRTHVLRLYQYKRCHTLLIYVSTEIEVDTRGIIEQALADGKKVAVPRCIPGTRMMDFHYIPSLEVLRAGAFSVPEPNPLLPVVTSFASCLMVVPALSLDSYGYRLGYGKGYYDRYMSEFTGQSVGLCYARDFRRHMYHGRFDRPVDLIITEKGIRKSIT